MRGSFGTTFRLGLHQRACFLRQAQQRLVTSAALEHTLTTEVPQSTRVHSPPVVPYGTESVNSVIVTGVALTDPAMYTLSASQMIVHLRLGLRQRHNQPSLPSAAMGAVSVDAFGALAQQLSVYVRKGDQLRVRGMLREDTWTDRGTGLPRRVIKIVAEELALVSQQEAGLESASAAQTADASNVQPAHPHASPLQQVPQRPRPQISRSVEQTVAMYEDGKPLEQIALQRNLKLATVLDHLLLAAEEEDSSFTAFQRLASDLQLGPPGHQWLSPAEVVEVVVALEQDQAYAGLDFRRLPLKAIREKLEAKSSTAKKVHRVVEQGNGSAILLYSAIKLVFAMLTRGVSFGLVSEPPSSLDAT